MAVLTSCGVLAHGSAARRVEDHKEEVKRMMPAPGCRLACPRRLCEVLAAVHAGAQLLILKFFRWTANAPGWNFPRMMHRQVVSLAQLLAPASLPHNGMRSTSAACALLQRSPYVQPSRTPPNVCLAGDLCCRLAPNSAQLVTLLPLLSWCAAHQPMPACSRSHACSQVACYLGGIDSPAALVAQNVCPQDGADTALPPHVMSHDAHYVRKCMRSTSARTT
jgi:hypothetical protein